MNGDDLPIGYLIRSARQELRMSQSELAQRLMAAAGTGSVGRDRVTRWECGRQVPRNEWRHWLSVVLELPKQRLDAGAAATRRRNQLGHAAVTACAPASSGSARRPQGPPPLLPFFRSRVQAGILAATLLNSSRAFSLTELADHAGGSLASVSKESEILEAAGILTRRNEGTLRLVRANTDRALIAPLTELIRASYGVPQIVGEEFGRVRGVLRIAVTGTWAARFAGISGPEPENIELCLTIAKEGTPTRDDLTAAARRAQLRLKRGITFSIAGSARRVEASIRSAAPENGGCQPIVEVALIDPPASQARVIRRWPSGDEVVAQLVEEGHLELVGGSDAHGAPFFDSATEYLDAAEALTATASQSAFLLICQAAQLLGSGLLAQQGLRSAPCVGDAVVTRAVMAQFGPQFSMIERLRQRQRSLDLADPIGRNSTAVLDVLDYLTAVRQLLASARQINRRLGLFS